LFVVAALCGPLTIALLSGYICWQGAKEYAGLTNLPTLHQYVVVAGGWLTLLGMLVFGREGLMVAPLIAFAGVTALALYPVPGEQEVGERFRLAQATLWGYLYLGWLPAHLLGLGLSNLPGLVLLAGTGVALSDVGAFCAGKAIGGPKLAPKLSPNKSWGGVLGSFLGAGLATGLVVLALSLGLEWWQMLLLAVTIGLGSVWGDLLESLIKRQRGVKDAGALLPGFGGLLDRIDSLLLVAPLVYYLVLIWK
jgi:phosphatidate cytidylyltransferase